MSDNKGFANALLLMINEESDSYANTNDDSSRSSLESTPTKVTRAEKKKLSVSNFISKDLMKTIDEDTIFNEDSYYKYNYSHNYSTDASDDKIPRHIRKGWVCNLCMNFNYESNV